jgi:hypothetical protein
MSLAEYLTGFAHFGATAGAVAAASVIVVRRTRPELRGSPRLLALAIAATCALLAVHLAPLALGVLSKGSVVVAAAVALGATLLLPRRSAGATAGRSESWWREEDPGLLALAVLGLLGVTAYVLAYTAGHLTTAVHDIDPMAIHLPGVARWIQSGSVWEINQFVPDQAHGNYPNNGDVLLLTTMLPWDNDFLVRFTIIPFLAVAGLSAYGIGRELGARRSASLLFAAVALATPAVLHPALYQAMPDAMMLAMFGSGAYFLLRHSRTARRGDLVLAGLGLGLAFGTKWYGVTTVAVIAVTWTAARALATRRRKGWLAPLARDLSLLVAAIALSGGFWLIRNLVESGNPVFPVEVVVLGVTLFDAPYDWVRAAAGFTIVDYAFEPHIWRRYYFNAFERTLGLPTVLVLLGAAAAVVQAVRARPFAWTPAAARIAAGAAAVVLIGVAYVVTPYSALGAEGIPSQVDANTRYMTPALPLAAGLAALALSRLRPQVARVVALAALVAILHGLARTGRLPVVDAAAALAGLALPGALLAWLARGGGERRLLRAGGRGAVLLGAAALLIAAAACGRAIEQGFADGRYADEDAVIDWINEEAPAGHRIGIVGGWTLSGIAPSYPAFGPRFENRVAYVGPFIDGMLRNYGNRASFLRGLRRGRYELLVVGRGFLRALPEVPHERWVRSVGWREVARSDRQTLYRAP